MTLVLGIDAAWTATQPSGVAFVASHGSTWRCVAVAPSYAAFDHLSRGTALDWADRPRGELPICATLLAAVERLAGRPPDVIAIDMPLSHRAIVARRAADAAVSRRFGARGCSTHSPSATRPGALSDRLRADLEHQGFPLVTTGTFVHELAHRAGYSHGESDPEGKECTVPNLVTDLAIWTTDPTSGLEDCCPHSSARSSNTPAATSPTTDLDRRQCEPAPVWWTPRTGR